MHKETVARQELNRDRMLLSMPKEKLWARRVNGYFDNLAQLVTKLETQRQLCCRHMCPAHLPS